MSEFTPTDLPFGGRIRSDTLDANLAAAATAIASKANTASPTFTGVPAAPTAVAATNTTQLATTGHVFAERANTATLTNKTLTAPVVNSPTGIVKADVGLGSVDNTSDAAKPVSSATQTALDLKSPIASPTFTGTPAAPTATAGTSTTQIATTAFVGAAAFNAALPAQTSNTDKVPTTDGTNASWTASLKASVMRWVDGTDITKKLAFGLSGITTATTRTMTVPDADFTVATLAANTFTGAQNTARATVASAATTADIWAAAGNQIDWTGTVTCTGFPAAPQAGAERVLICAGAAVFTAGANMLIDGVASASDLTCAANDTVIVRAVTTTQFKLSRVKYDGTAQVASASLAAATQAEAEAATADTAAITPLSANWHPGVAKVWLNCGRVGGITASHNVTSITDTGAGVVTVTIATDFSSTGYVIVATPVELSNKPRISIAAGYTAGSFIMNCVNNAGSAEDPTDYLVVCFGDQA